MSASGNIAPVIRFYGSRTGTLVQPVMGGAGWDFSQSIKVQADGKILIAGYSFLDNPKKSDFSLVRLNSDGSLDTSFNGNGKLIQPVGNSVDSAFSLAIQSDGKILVAGESYDATDPKGWHHASLVRLNTDGSLDSSFSGDGLAIQQMGQGPSAVYSMILQPDGKILVTGLSYSYTGTFGVLRLNTDGILDTSFNGTGSINQVGGESKRITLQSDGKIVVAGVSDGLAVMRFNSNGSLDTSFSGDGMLDQAMVGAKIRNCIGVHVQADGKILIAGTSDSNNAAPDAPLSELYTTKYYDFYIVRLNKDGTLDTSFNGTGTLVQSVGSGQVFDQASGLTVQADGKILVAGTTATADGKRQFCLIRLNTDGSLDTSFSGDGKVFQSLGNSLDSAGEVTLQSDGKILVTGIVSPEAGGRNFAAIRFNSDGSLDTSFGTREVVTVTILPYTENALPTGLAGTSPTEVADKDLDALNNGAGDYGGASITLVRQGGANADDLFSGLSLLSFTNGSAWWSGTEVGKVVNAAGSLKITFASGTSRATVNSVLTSIGYSNASDAPAASVTINWSFSDGNTGSQGPNGVGTAVGSTVVEITAVNDAPALTGSLASLQGVEDLPTTFSTADLLTGFWDDGGIAQLKISNLTAERGSLTANGNGTYTLRQDANFNGAVVLRYTVADANGVSVNASRQVEIRAVNDLPTLVSAIADQITAEDAAFSLTVPAANFVDVDVGDALSLSAKLPSGATLPNWLRFDAETRTFSGTPTNTDVGTLSVILIATDNSRSSSGDTFDIVITNVNDAPTLATPLADKFTAEDAPFSLTLPASAFVDFDVGDVLTYSAKLASGAALPNWLIFDAATRTFSGVPTHAEVGQHSVTVTATDRSNATVSDTFEIAVFQPPVLTGTPNPLAAALEDTPSTISVADLVSGYTGYSVNTLSVSNLRADYGSVVDNGNGTYTVTPNTDFNGTLQLSYAVVDGAGGWANATRQITFVAVNEAPTIQYQLLSGKLIQPVGDDMDYGSAVTVQTDGKILVAGTSYDARCNVSFSLIRLNTDGSLDSTFNGTGKRVEFVGTSVEPRRCLTLQADGKVLVAGTINDARWSTDFSLMRLNTDGSLDATFNGTGKLIQPVGSSYDYAYAITTQADGKILVAGRSLGDDWSSAFSIIRLNLDGSLDRSFNGTGKLIQPGGGYDVVKSVTVQTDGKILVAGTGVDANFRRAFSLVRLNTDGSLDRSFNATGKVVQKVSTFDDEASSVTLQADGKILVAGTSRDANWNTTFSLIRLNIDGSLDTTFNGTGKLLQAVNNGRDEACTVTVQTDGKILVAGTSRGADWNTDFGLIRLNSDGSLDTSFNGTGKLLRSVGKGSDEARGLAVQADGKILVAGTSAGELGPDFSVIRINDDGTVDDSFGAVGGASTNQNKIQYSENGTSVVLAIRVVISDKDLDALNNGAGDYGGASITLVRQGGANADDLFSGLSLLSFTNGSAWWSGTEVGKVVNAAGSLKITFASGTSRATVNSVLTSIGYSNTSDAPAASVTINWSFSDGNTGSQGPNGVGTAVGSTVVEITAVNDAPVLTGSPASLQGVEDSPTTFSTDDLLTGFWDDGGIAQLKISNLTAERGSLTANGNGTYTLRQDANFNGAVVLRYTVADANGVSVNASRQVEIRAVNDFPTLVSAIADQITAEDAAFSLTVPAANFVDVDVGDALSFSAMLASGAALPNWLSFDAATCTFTGTPGNSEVGRHIIILTGTDGSNASVSDIFEIVVTNVNDAPVLVSALADATVAEGAALSLTLPKTAFADVDVGDVLTHSAQLDSGAALPSWLSFNAATSTFSGVPTNHAVGTLGVTVTATDQSGAAVSETFDIVVTIVNHVPTLATPLADKTTAEDAAFSLTLPTTVFADVDVGDVITYSAKLASGAALPNWLSFDAATLTFSGTPANAQVGTLSVMVTATDTSSASVSDTFDIVVTNVNDTPILVTPLADKTTAEDAAFSLTLPVTAFADVDVGDVLSYSAKLASGAALPSWLSFDAATRTFSGTPANAQVGTLSVTVTATDTSSASVSDTFDIVVTASTVPKDLMGTALADHLTGGGGDDTLNGRAGNDTLTGGVGADTFVVRAGIDTISDLGNGKDILAVAIGATANATVFAAWTATLGTNNSGVANISTNGLEVNLAAVCMGSAGYRITNTGATTRVTGSELADTLTGGVGNDTLAGGIGNDTYVVDSSTDTITEFVDGGTDTLVSSVTQTALAANVENLTLSGTTNLSATGNTLANVMSGNAGDNTLTGGLGADTFVVGAGVDTITDLGNGVDLLKVATGATANATVFAAWTATAGTTNSGVANISTNAKAVSLAAVTTGTAGYNVTNSGAATKLTGSALADTLTGGAGNDTLDGGLGMDMLAGGTGADLLYGGIDTVKDIFKFTAVSDSTTAVRDKIYNFLSGTDKIDFSAIDANSALAGDQAFANTSIGTVAKAYSIWTKVSGKDLLISADTDGVTSTIEFQVQLVGVTQVALADFVL